MKYSKMPDEPTPVPGGAATISIDGEKKHKGDQSGSSSSETSEDEESEEEREKRLKKLQDQVCNGSVSVHVYISYVLTVLQVPLLCRFKTFSVFFVVASSANGTGPAYTGTFN